MGFICWRNGFYLRSCTWQTVSLFHKLIKSNNPIGKKTSASCQDCNTSCGVLFKVSRRTFFFKSKQCLTKTFIRYLKKRSQKCLQAGRILDIGAMGAFFWGGSHLFEKGNLLLSPKVMLFSTISSENTFSETQGTKLSAIIRPSNVLE